MDAPEAEGIARAFANMQRHYGGVLASKTIDTVNFVGVVTIAYVGRGIRIRARKRAARPAAVHGRPGFPGGVAPPGPGTGGPHPSLRPGTGSPASSPTAPVSPGLRPPAPQGELPDTDGLADTDDLLTGFQVMGSA
jgi:hypothetical protein